jgi:hypothetical protein
MQSEDISAGVRTVAHLSKYFDELKTRAGQLAAGGSAQKRGYFTPAEEDEARAMLVSYWHARRALSEVVDSFRSDADLADEHRPAAFLTAFAGGLVLFDAARFLRDAFHDSPVVRQKLNEPAPQFGLPADVYDQVQKSLVSTRNAWHLYHAAKYFEEHEGMFRALAAEGELAPMLRLVIDLQHRRELSVTRFARTKLRTRASQMFRRAWRDTMGRAMYGLQKVAGEMMAERYLRPGHRPRLPAAIADEFRGLLAPGDVLVMRKEYALTNYFLPGYWPHAAIYLGDPAALERLGLQAFEPARSRWERLLEGGEEPRRVLESMRDGVLIRPLTSPFSSDSLVVLRPRLDEAGVATALARGLSHEGKPYDFDFDFTRSDRLVCTGVVYRAFEGVGPIRFDLKRRLGRLTLSSGDLIDMGISRRGFDPIAVYAPTLARGVITGPAVEDVLRAAAKEPQGSRALSATA